MNQKNDGALIPKEITVGRPLYIATFKNQMDNTPHCEALPWEQLCRILGSHRTRERKDGGPTWSPVRYPEGAIRGNGNVIDVHLAVLDIDGGATIEDFKPRLDGYAYVLHTSFSHKEDHPKFRVILPLTTPVKAAEWHATWLRINAKFGGFNDPSCKDPARIYFLPAHPPGASEHKVEVGEGQWLDVEALPPLSSEAPALLPAAAAIAVPRVEIEGIETTEDLSPAQGLDAVTSRCNFMKEASAPECQPAISEPLWMALVSNACRFENAESWIHSASSHHPKYSEAETSKKIERCRAKAGPVTCAHIQSLGFSKCPEGGCLLRSGIPTKAPAGLGTWIYGPPASVAATKGPVVVTGQVLQVPQKVADFTNEFFPNGLIYMSEAFYAYTAGYFKELDERTEVRLPAGQYLVRQLGEKTTSTAVTSLLDLVKDFCPVSSDAMAPDKGLICLTNGTLDTHRFRLLPHDARYRLTTKVPIEWSETAQCERWETFLSELFRDDIDREQKIRFLQEFAGYCLVPDVSQHKFLWLIGGGGNGKSVFLNILRRLIGEANVSNAHLDRLDDKGVRAELQGKLVNISSEMSAEVTIADGYLKEIVAGDVIEAERKYKPSFSFRPYVRLIGATNHLPRLLDTSDGFFRRAVVIQFNRQFTGEECDPLLEEKLVAELPGILRWAVDGLRRLRSRGHFEIPPSSNALLARYRVEADPVALFAEERLERSSDGRVRTADLYDHYEAWRERNGFNRLNIATFGKRLKALNLESRLSGGYTLWSVRLRESGQDGSLSDPSNGSEWRIRYSV